MDNILTVVNGIGWFMGALGAAVAVFFVAYSGYLFISAQGDPQRMAQARGSLIGVVVGLVVIGGAFIIPGTISRFIIEPAGGVPVEPRGGFDCDGLLKEQLVFQRNAFDDERMQFVISRIQSQRSECGPESWSPVVRAASWASTRLFGRGGFQQGGRCSGARGPQDERRRGEEHFQPGREQQHHRLLDGSGRQVRGGHRPARRRRHLLALRLRPGRLGRELSSGRGGRALVSALVPALAARRGISQNLSIHTMCLEGAHQRRHPPKAQDFFSRTPTSNSEISPVRGRLLPPAPFYHGEYSNSGTVSTPAEVFPPGGRCWRGEGRPGQEVSNRPDAGIIGRSSGTLA